MNTGIQRYKYRKQVARALEHNPIVAVLGSRQCGKTTLARYFVVPDSANYFDLEDPVAAQLLSEPMTALSGLSGLVVIDEAQRQPGIFPVLRVLADRENHPAKFLILGSASPEFSRQASESLAGRIEVIEMGGFSLQEVGLENMNDLWLRATDPDEAYFWAVHSGSELDLLLIRDGRKTGVEFKRYDAPKLTRSMSTAIDDLELDELYVVYPGQRSYAHSDKTRVISISEIHAI
jgi:predicted AAA+ superfamily ATPase